MTAPQTIPDLPLTRIELDESQCPCGKADCDDELFFHGRCHPGAEAEAGYNKRTGILTLKCRVCKKLVARIKVAAGHVDISQP